MFTLFLSVSSKDKKVVFLNETNKSFLLTFPALSFPDEHHYISAVYDFLQLIYSHNMLFIDLCDNDRKLKS